MVGKSLRQLNIIVKTRRLLEQVYSSREISCIPPTYSHQAVDRNAKYFRQFSAGNSIQQFFPSMEQVFLVDHLNIFQPFFD
jgi:hypothetical protein